MQTQKDKKRMKGRRMPDANFLHTITNPVILGSPTPDPYKTYQYQDSSSDEDKPKRVPFDFFKELSPAKSVCLDDPLVFSDTESESEELKTKKNQIKREAELRKYMSRKNEDWVNNRKPEPQVAFVKRPAPQGGVESDSDDSEYYREMEKLPVYDSDGKEIIIPIRQFPKDTSVSTDPLGSEDEELPAALDQLYAGHYFICEPNLKETEGLLTAKISNPGSQPLSTTQINAIKKMLEKEKKRKFDQEHEDVTQYIVHLKCDPCSELQMRKEENCVVSEKMETQKPESRPHALSHFESLFPRCNNSYKKRPGELSTIEELSSAVEETPRLSIPQANGISCEPKPAEPTNGFKMSDEPKVKPELTFTDSESDDENLLASQINSVQVELTAKKELTFTDSESEDEAHPPPAAEPTNGFNMSDVSNVKPELTFTDSESEDESLPAPVELTSRFKMSVDLKVKPEMTFTDSESEDDAQPTQPTNEFKMSDERKVKPELTSTDSESDNENLPASQTDTVQVVLTAKKELTFTDSESEDEAHPPPAAEPTNGFNMSDESKVKPELTFTDSESEDESLPEPVELTTGFKMSVEPKVKPEMTFTDSESEDDAQPTEPTNEFKMSDERMVKPELTFTDSESDNENLPASQMNSVQVVLTAKKELTFTDSESEDEAHPAPAEPTNDFKISVEPKVKPEMAFTDSESEDEDRPPQEPINFLKISVEHKSKLELTFTHSESEDKDPPPAPINGLKIPDVAEPKFKPELTFTDSESEDEAQLPKSTNGLMNYKESEVKDFSANKDNANESDSKLKKEMTFTDSSSEDEA